MTEPTIHDPAKPEADARLHLPPHAPVMAIDPEWLNRPCVPRSGFLDDLFGKRKSSIARVGRTAVIGVGGPLDQRSSWLWLGYDEILSAFRAAATDPDTDAIALRLDSPGGVCAGCFEAVRQMREMKLASGKPVLAYADEMAYSAAYALASVADEIWLPASGGVGSIGVIAAYQDVSKALDNAGIRIAVVASGSKKTDSHPAVPLTDGAISRLRSDVMHLADLFFDAVAESRTDLSKEEIKALQAGTYRGQKAVDAKLADHVGSFEEARAAIEKKAAERRHTNAGARALQETDHMANDSKQAAPAAPAPAVTDLGATLVASAEATITVKEHESALSALRASHDASAEKHAAEVKGLNATIEALTSAKDEAATRAKLAEAKLQLVEDTRLEAKVDALVGKKITAAERNDQLEILRALGEQKFDAMIGKRPDLGLGLGEGRKIPEASAEGRPTDSSVEAQLAADTAKRMKEHGESRPVAARNAMNELHARGLIA